MIFVNLKAPNMKARSAITKITKRSHTVHLSISQTSTNLVMALADVATSHVTILVEIAVVTAVITAIVVEAVVVVVAIAEEAVVVANAEEAAVVAIHHAKNQTAANLVVMMTQTTISIKLSMWETR